MERSFGRSLSHVTAYTGVADHLAPLGATALATGDVVAFASSSPAPSVVAHELAHVLQRPGTSEGGGVRIGARTSSAELEADAIAARIEHHGAGARLPPICATTSAPVHLQPGPGGMHTTLSAEDVALLRAWIETTAPPSSATQPAPPPRFDPAAALADTRSPLDAWAMQTLTPSPRPTGSMMSARDLEALRAFMASDGTATQTATTATSSVVEGPHAPAPPVHAAPPSFDFNSQTHTFTSISTPTTVTQFPSLLPPRTGGTGMRMEDDLFGTPRRSRPCPNCHGSYYQHVPPSPPPYDPHPDWVASRDANHDEVLSREGRTTDETEETLELQVIMAEGRAIAAAADAGAVPADLREAWQQAMLTAEELRQSAPGLAASAPEPQPGVAQPALDEALTERTRETLDAFYWGLIDALVVQEARQRREEERSRQIHDLFQPQRPSPCPNCHTTYERPTQFPIYVAPAPSSPTVTARARALATATTFAEWRASLRDFERTVAGPLESLLASVLPDTSRDRQQLRLARQLRDRVATLRRDHPGIIRIPAVFYPRDDIRQEPNAEGGGTHAVAQGYSWYLFLYQQDDGTFVLKDVTSDREFTNRQAMGNRGGWESLANSRSVTLFNSPVDEFLVRYPNGVMNDLFRQLNTAIRFPCGMLYYELPGGRRRQLETTEPWEMSTWLGTIGIALAALGLVLVTGGAGTPAAIAFAASGVVSAAGALAHLEELQQQGIATTGDRLEAALAIAVDLIGAFSLGLGQIARAPAIFGSAARLAGRLYAPVRTLSLGLNVAQAAVMTHHFVSQFAQLISMPPSAERTSAMRRLVLVGLATGALTFVALRSDLHELGQLRARPRLVDANGLLALAEGEAVGTLSHEAAQQGTGWRWRWSGQVEPTAADPSVGDRSVVVDVERGPDGLVQRVAVRHGPNASAGDIARHERIARIMASYGGFQGRVRLFWQEILGRFGLLRRRPPVHLEMEVAKLEATIRDRMRTASNPSAPTAVREQAERDLVVLEHNLAQARREAQLALAAPATAEPTHSQIWFREAPAGATTPEGMEWYLGREGRVQLRNRPGVDMQGAQIRAEYDSNGAVIEVSNRAQVQRSRVIGQSLDDVRDRLEAMGYTVDVNGVISRRSPGRDHMIGLRADPTTRIVSESVRETEAQVQARLEASLTGPQRTALAAARSAAASAADREVVLLDGISDLRATWTETLDANGGRAASIDALEARGVSRSEATRIIDGLMARTTPMQAVRGTTPLRYFDYAGHYAGTGGTVPAGGHVHHADPLYLGGTHELLSGLDAETHDLVHDFFDNLLLPASSAVGRQRLEPNSLFSAVTARGGWQRGAATLYHGGSVQPGRIDFQPL